MCYLLVENMDVEHFNISSRSVADFTHDMRALNVYYSYFHSGYNASNH